MVRYTTFKLALSLAIVFLPLVKLEDCPPRTIVEPDNKAFLSLCGPDPDAPDVAKENQKQACFKLIDENLHNVRVSVTTLPNAKPGNPGRIIVKDGDLNCAYTLLLVHATYFEELCKQKLTKV
ncbi:uncharacterized protein UTRI_02636 [Ustilago trichophora]|uniref:Uncharacterized protein n=1 Tax=Ustilago trichophora TaxID=86804 RepID=A0A5C3ERV7_9BASI|nr:uncharacterized protein UTRI_02636 [Ustilago trichophora]